MIISTVNLVNNYKFSDFIIDKIKEEQNQQDEELRKKHKRSSLCAPNVHKEVELQPRKRTTAVRFKPSEDYDRSPRLYSAEQDRTTDYENHPAVTIETTDDFWLTTDLHSLHVRMRKTSDLSETNVFRQIDFGPDPEGAGQLTVFQLLCNPSYYLATTHFRHLELQSYCDDTLDPECPDERFFRCFHSQFGADLLQPYSHKGYYIHHIDDFIALRKLELNFRPPEEYFVCLKPCEPEAIDRLLNNETSQPLDNIPQGHAHYPSSTASCNSLPRPAVPDISKSSLKRKDSKKSAKTKASPITPKQGMLSCFGLSSFKKKKKKDKTK